jgi:hypothetical protein
MRPSSLLNALDKIVAVREVSVTMQYAVYEHDDIISPNTITFPSITDSIDKKTCEGLRELWLNAVRQNNKISAVVLDDKPEDETPIERLFVAMTKALHGQFMESFVRSAAYPVPAEYTVSLPVRSNMRVDIISNLIPFERTRDMLLRLEDKLESPMRVLHIGHAPADAIGIFRASNTGAQPKTVIFN